MDFEVYIKNNEVICEAITKDAKLYLEANWEKIIQKYIGKMVTSDIICGIKEELQNAYNEERIKGNQRFSDLKEIELDKNIIIEDFEYITIQKIICFKEMNKIKTKVFLLKQEILICEIDGEYGRYKAEVTAVIKKQLNWFAYRMYSCCLIDIEFVVID